MRLPIQIEAILFRRTNRKFHYLILKTIPGRGGFWQPITGGLEQGETKIEALKREVREETGIKNIIRIIEDVYHFEFQDLSLIEYLKKHGQGSKYLKEFAFGVEVSSDEEVILDGKEHSEFKWCSFPEALGKLKWEENREALKRLNARARSSFFRKFIKLKVNYSVLTSEEITRMGNIVMFVVGVLMCVAGVAIMITNFWGENSTTGGIVFGIIGIVFIATSRTSTKLL